MNEKMREIRRIIESSESPQNLIESLSPVEKAIAEKAAEEVIS